MTDDQFLSEEEISHMFQIVRASTATSAHAMLAGIERLYRIERAKHAVARIRIMHAQAALDVVYGQRVHGEQPARRATDLKAV